jgi:hypothetical protein
MHANPARVSLATLAAVAVLYGTGCEQRTTTVLTGHAVRGSDVNQLAIGRATRDDVVRVLGAPDERAADGSMVYRADAVRRTDVGLGGLQITAREEVVSQRSTTFRFAGDVLQRICRERS